MEPALSQTVIKAVSLPDVHRTIDPWRLCDALARDFVRRGGEIVAAEVKGFEIGADGPTKIVTDRGAMDVEQVVIAAGVWSRPLAEQLGTSVPLEAERGYHVDVRPAGFRSEACAGLGRPQCLAHPDVRGLPRHRRRGVRRSRCTARHAHRRHGDAPCQGAGARAEGRGGLEMDGPAPFASRFQAGDRPLAATQERLSSPSATIISA